MTTGTKTPRGNGGPPRQGKGGPPRQGEGAPPRGGKPSSSGRGPNRGHHEGSAATPQRRGSPPQGRRRQALVHHGGDVEVRGDEALTDLFRRAFAAWAEDADVLTHGFHSYPARMHPLVARVLLELARPDDIVLDPFCGSGTTLVEARRRGLRAAGNDLNPLALRVADVKCHPLDPDTGERFVHALEEVVEASCDRVREKAKSHAPIPPELVKRFQPHVLRELGGLYEEIQTVDDRVVRRVLEVLLSSIVVKFSNRRGDSSEDEAPKRVGRFFPSEFFGKKGEELLRRWGALLHELPEDAPRAKLGLGDVRELKKTFPGLAANLVVSSPPYGGTYDYAGHHALRFPWLGLDARDFEKKELGARRRLSGDDAVARWNGEVTEALKALRHVVADDGLVIFLMGDAQLGGVRIPADRQLEELAPTAGFIVVAVASEERPDWTGGPPRQEHLVALRTKPKPPREEQPPSQKGERRPPRGEERRPPRGEERRPPRGEERRPPRGEERRPPRSEDRRPPRSEERRPPRGDRPPRR